MNKQNITINVKRAFLESPKNRALLGAGLGSLAGGLYSASNSKHLTKEEYFKKLMAAAVHGGLIGAGTFVAPEIFGVDVFRKS